MNISVFSAQDFEASFLHAAAGSNPAPALPETRPRHAPVSAP